MAHLLGAREPRARVPDEGRLRARHDRHRRGRPHRRRRTQRRRQVDPAPAARRAPAARLGPGHPSRRRDDRDARPGRRAADRTRPSPTPSSATAPSTSGRATPGSATSIAGLVGDIPWDARSRTSAAASAAGSRSPALLSRDWDVVFLDEPTNHLDIEGVAWLAAHLQEALAGEPGRPRGRHPRPLVPRRGVDRHLGGARPHRRAVRGRLRRLRAPARRARPAGGGERVEAPQPACARSSPGCDAVRPPERRSRSSGWMPRPR